MKFIFSRSTRIQPSVTSHPIANAISMLKRDMEKTLTDAPNPKTILRLQENSLISSEAFELSVADSQTMVLYASDDLGFVYGLLFISRHFLGIQPFWFWMDQQIPVLGTVSIPCRSYAAPVPAVRFRGWFLNDEVLLMHWNNGMDKNFPWHMAFEALLRCGGNMVIPGTDKTSRLYASLASDYGLWLTHHHAEPLGAELFARAYPDLSPSYSRHPDYFQKLWEEGVIRQKEQRVIWTLGFRGQGDCPFWESKGEEGFDTPQKRGQLISELIELQRQIVCKYVEHPIFCTNLYGEIMELYQEGFISLHPDIIKIWADNGYGKMCTRRQDNHCTRTPALPDPQDKSAHGVYYHVSFHDLQAAGHMTTLPNTVDFVNQELGLAYERGADDYWIINSSNIRPHVYYLDAIRKLWFGRSVSDASHSREFAADYFEGRSSVACCLESYARSLLSYGKHADQHAGEQFYNYCVRLLARQFIIDKNHSCRPLYWLTGERSFYDQAAYILEICLNGNDRLSSRHTGCLQTSAGLSGSPKKLFDATVLLQSEIHYHCCQGLILFCRGLLSFQQAACRECFYLLGCAAQEFDSANSFMRQAEYGVWKGFYENDCLTDIKFTAYMIRTMMGVVRITGDDQRLAEWYEDFVRAKEDRKVRLLSITENHMTDIQLFEAMKKAGFMS